MASSGLRSSVLPSVTLNATIRPLWLMSRWSLKPKNQPMVLRPRLANPRKTRLRLMRALWQTAKAPEQGKRTFPSFPLSKTRVATGVGVVAGGSAPAQRRDRTSREKRFSVLPLARLRWVPFRSNSREALRW